MTTEQQFNCVFCNESFCNKEDLQIHFRKHADPNFNKSTKSKTRLNDYPNSNEKLTEDNEMVGCDVCDEVFPTISKAITHKHKIHPDHDAKYFCPFCGKLFTMKHLYNKHIQTTHDSQSSVEKSDFHCDSCEVMFYVPSAMLYHNKFFHRQDPDLPGIGGSKKVKLCSQEMIQLYYCAFCGEEYNNKINLQKHVGDDHGDENQRPMDILKCPLCEAMFYHLDAYELHLMFHTTEDMYSEKNEMANEITDFSLETVPPIAEKIEEEQDLGEPEGMENFLQLLLDEPEENSEKIKTKKHKKHKKAKKAAITLDEFLNMNKDVFGDGLDVQGIEEVPTQVVLKKIQGNKTFNNKKTINADINKLKKQGITVKTKSGNIMNPIINRGAFNKMASISSNIEDKKQNVIKDPEDLLSKLIRQGNSQIKIVKKSANQIVKDDITTTNQINDPESTGTDQNQGNNTTNEASNSNQGKDKTVMESDMVQDTEDENKELCNGTIEPDNITTEDNNTNAKDQRMEDETNKYDNSNCSENVSEMLNKSDPEKLSEDISQSKNGTEDETSKPSSDEHDEDHSSDLDLDPTDVTCNDTTKDLENECSSNKTIGALKHLSHLITIKPVKQDKSNLNTTDDNKKQNITKKDSVNISNDEITVTSTQLNTNISTKNSEALKNLNNNLTIKSIITNMSNSKTDCMNEKLVGYFNNPNSDESNSIVKTSSESKTLSMESSNQNEIDKSKPVSDNQNLLNNSSTTQQTANKINQNETLVTKPTIINAKQEKPIEKGIDNDIEIFNIDDSDSEEDTNKKVEVSKNVTLENTKQSIHLQNVLQSLGSNITIKSSHQKTNEIKSKNNTESQFPSTTTSNKFKKVNKPSPAIQKSINLQNTLKNLGSHITIKSKNSSSTYSKEEHTSFDDEDDQSDQHNENDSDSEEVGKVKITEITEEGNDLDNESHGDCDTNAIVQSPEGHDSDSDNQSNGDSDFDDKIEESALEKPDHPVSSVPDNIKCLNKDLVIKSINDKRINPGNGSNKKISTPVNNGSKSTSQNSGSPYQMNTLNRKTNTSANEVNTVKTVKKYQTETVIQEITTVTRTIRTVNESSNESVMQTGNQTCLSSQKFGRSLPVKEHQGKIVRHVAPTVGTKVMIPGNVRPTNMTPVRTPNQIVPIRSISNTVPQTNQMQRKTLAPGVQIVRNTASPTGSPQRLVSNKLKMSPHVINQTTMKRPSDNNSNIQSVSGIKKSKEFNVSLPTSKTSDTSIEQFSASTSRSEFSNVTKTVKGKTLISTTQRSEVSTQQQRSRLNNMSGLKIMKTSTKQSNEVEKSVVCASKRNTLEALEKLQKQGLLIKKPRVEIESNDQEYFSESDDDNFEQ